MGIPLVVSRTTAAVTYFDDDMVKFFNPNDENDLARSILELHRSPEKRKALSQNAERFNQQHNWERYKKAYYQLLDNL